MALGNSLGSSEALVNSRLEFGAFRNSRAKSRLILPIVFLATIFMVFRTASVSAEEANPSRGDSALSSGLLCRQVFDQRAAGLNKKFPFTPYHTHELMRTAFGMHARLSDFSEAHLRAAADKFVQAIDPFEMFLTKKDVEAVKSLDPQSIFGELMFIDGHEAGPLDRLRKKAAVGISAGYRTLLAPGLRKRILDRADELAKPQERERVSADAELNAAILHSLANHVLKLKSVGVPENDAVVFAIRSVVRSLRELNDLVSDRALPTLTGKSMIAAMDAHSRYSPPEVFRQAQLNMGEASQAGIGISIGEAVAGVRVADVHENSPAARAGLRKEDVVTHVDGRSIRGRFGTSEPLGLTGAAGTPVVVRIKRGEEQFEISIVRETIKAEFMSAMNHEIRPATKSSLGVIRFANFYNGLANDFGGRLRQMISEFGVRGLLIDLRGNPGGQVSEAAELLSYFIKRGTLVTLRSQEQIVRAFDVNQNRASYTELPLVILIDHNSASASEIVAAVLQDYGRAIIVGTEQSFGKGNFQNVFPLPRDGSYGGVNITAGLFHSASGRSPQFNGVRADIVIDRIPRDAVLERTIPGALEPGNGGSFTIPLEQSIGNRPSVIAELKSRVRERARRAERAEKPATDDPVLSEALKILEDLSGLAR